MAWLAPQPWSSGGRSAEIAISGTPEWLASITAGNQLAGAVPEVARSSTGRRLALATPRAKNAALRSSTATVHCRPGWRSIASASGVDREPGEITACVVPAATNPATIACDQRKLSVPGSIMVPIRKVQAVAVDCRKGQACTCPALQNRIRRSANRAAKSRVR